MKGSYAGVGFGVLEENTPSPIDDDLLTAIREMQGETEKMQAQTRIILKGIDRKLDDIHALLHGETKAL